VQFLFYFLCLSSLALHIDGWFWVKISDFEKYAFLFIFEY